MSIIQKQVSKGKYRFIAGEYNLDLAYIKPRIIAMGFPGEGFESIIRNPRDIVRDFLNENHFGKYKIYNLSEKLYPASDFNGGEVENFSFPDHHAPSFPQLLEIMNSMHQWYSADETNVVAVHCMAGIGRTGTIICSFFVKGKFLYIFF